jgi:hypothetical protein
MKPMKPWMKNFLRLTAVAVVAAILLVLCALLPDLTVIGMRIDAVLATIFLNTLLFVAVGMTGKLYGGCVLAFLFPVMRFLIMDMTSPLLMIPEVMAGCFMLLVSVLISRKAKKPSIKLIGNLGAGIVNFLVRWVMIGFIYGHNKLIKVVMMFENVYDEAGYVAGKQALMAESVNFQWLAAIAAALLAFVLLPPVLKFIKKKKY